MSESKTKETASRLSLSASWWAGVLPCLARPLSLSCHATTIAQLDVSVCLIFKRVALCLCVPCCLAPACLVPLLPRLPCMLCGLACCAWCVCLACCASLLSAWPCVLSPGLPCLTVPVLSALALDTVWPGLLWLFLSPVVLACLPLPLPWLWLSI